MSEVEVRTESEVSVSVGDTVTLRLPENATTGYVWSVEDLGAGLTVEDDRTVPSSGGAPGEAGEHVVRLTAREPGTWPVALRRARAWEAEPLEERRLTVSVT